MLTLEEVANHLVQSYRSALITIADLPPVIVTELNKDDLYKTSLHTSCGACIYKNDIGNLCTEILSNYKLDSNKKEFSSIKYLDDFLIELDKSGYYTKGLPGSDY